MDRAPLVTACMSDNLSVIDSAEEALTAGLARALAAALAPGDTLDVRIFQLSALVGRGAPKTVTLSF